MKINDIKLMLLGIALILVCLYIQGEPGINMYGNEFFIGLTGFVLVVIGFFFKQERGN